MDSQLKKYFLAAGLVGLSYALFNYFSQEKHKPVPLKFAQKILQQIKHQMLIATVNFSESVKNHVNAKVGSIKGAESQLLDYMLNEMEKIYKSKQQLILNKYEVSEGSYRVSLKLYEKDDFIKKNAAEIIEMMQRAVEGKTPDLTVPQEAFEAFTKQELHEFYFQMCIRIAKLVVKKLQELMEIDPYFDPMNDLCFRRAIRQLLIYDVKVQFLKLKGFKEIWGCPNQTFFKIFQAHKLKSPEYKKEMLAIEKTYERVIEIATNDTKSLNSQKIQEIFSSLNKQKKKITQSMANPPTSDKNYFQEADLSFKKTISRVEKIQHEQPEQNILTSIRTSVQEEQVEELKPEQKEEEIIGQKEGEQMEKEEESQKKQEIPVKQEEQEKEGQKESAQEKAQDVIEKEEVGQKNEEVENANIQNKEQIAQQNVEQNILELAKQNDEQVPEQNVQQVEEKKEQDVGEVDEENGGKEAVANEEIVKPEESEKMQDKQE